MKRVALVLAVIAGAYLAGLTYVAWQSHAAEAAWIEQLNQVVTLGAKLADPAHSKFGDAPLKEACEGKLTPGEMRSIAVYTLPLKGNRPTLDGKRVDGVVARVSQSGTFLEMLDADPVQPARGLSDYFSRRSEFYEWPRYLEQVETQRHATQSLRFVAVTEFVSLTPASLPLFGTGKSFDPGQAIFNSAVLSFPDGAVICSGSGVGRMVEKVVGHGRARSTLDAKAAARDEMLRKLRDKWIEATIASPLQEVCNAGGKKLCDLTELYTNGPDW